MKQVSLIGAPLTKRQRAVFDYVWQFLADYGVPPTLESVRYAFGWKSTNAARCYLQALEVKGYIKRERRKARGITIVRQP